MNYSLDGVVESLRVRRHGLARYMNVFSHTTQRERLALYQLAKFLPHQARALEIGSHLGSSALFICAGLSGNGGHLYCVDTWMNETMDDGVHDTFPSFMKNTEEFTSIITPIRKNSNELVYADITCDLDFAFIDGDHSESQVRTDFHIVSGLMKIGGVVAFHDIRPKFPGPNIVVGEAMVSSNWQLCGLVESLGWLKRMA